MPEPLRSKPFPSKSREGVTYHLIEHGGRFFCDCPGFDRKQKGECPHSILRRKEMTNAVAIRKDPGKDLVPEGYQAIELRPPPQQERLPSNAQFDMMMKIAAMAVTGANQAEKTDRALPLNIKTPEQAMTVMLAGYELGMPPFTALRRLYLVNGRVELETQALMGLVKAGDPTAHFVFGDYSRDRVEVSLYLQGEHIITVDYTREDAIQSGQLKETWWRKKQDGRDVVVNKDQYQLRPGERFGPPAGTGQNAGVFVMTPGNSVWQQYTRDMLAYSAVKRCCRLGAPELTNQIIPQSNYIDAPYQITETARARGDEDDAPINPVSKALAEGTASPAEVLGGDKAVEDAEQPQEAAPTQDTAPTRKSRSAAAVKAPAASEAPSDNEPAGQEILKRIEARLTLLNKGNAEQSPIDKTAYTALYRKIRDQHMGGTFNLNRLTAAGAAAVWDMVKPEEPPADTTPGGSLSSPSDEEQEPEPEDPISADATSEPESLEGGAVAGVDEPEDDTLTTEEEPE